MKNDFPDLDFDIPLIEEDASRPKESKPLYTLDVETDPFKYGRFPIPFACGLYDGKRFESTWGKNCIEEMIEKIMALPAGIIYMHNGGKFDIFYFMRLILGNPAFIVNRRIIRAIVKLNKGYHELRDSYAIMPFSLAQYEKDEIDYRLFEKETRESNRAEIISYLKKDCVSLFDLVDDFSLRFGPVLTIGTASMRELQKLHSFERMGPLTDGLLRKSYYYGGRVEYFEHGVLKGDWKVYDVNSMYPFSMSRFDHPLGLPDMDTKKIRKATCFLTVEGKNYGAFPRRIGNSLRFDIEDGIFHVTRHEFDVAMEHDLFRPSRIVRCVNFMQRGNFNDFVTQYHDMRRTAKEKGDLRGALFYKYVLNSAYGKFAQNPKAYQRYVIDSLDSDWRDAGYTAALIPDDLPGIRPEWEFILWEKPSPDFSRYNVATGASITGAARSVLLEAIANSERVIYCDTDSIICKNLRNVKFHDSELGAWKLEAEADEAMIGGRKLYALTKNGELVKMATKGVKIGIDEVREVCNGGTITYRRDAPTFGLDGSVKFIERKVRAT